MLLEFIRGPKIVLIEKGDQRATREFQECIASSRGSAIRLAMNLHTRIGHLQRLHRAVGGTIIEHDQLPILIRLAQNTFNGESQVGAGVEDWNEDTELGRQSGFG